jgi:flagellin
MPALGELAKSRTNIAALNALSALDQINKRLNFTNLRLATGKRINSAADDPSGLTLSSSLDLRSRKLGAAINNIGDATSVLSIAESGLSNINGILATLTEKITLAQSDTQGASERSAIFQELNQLGEEIDSLSTQTQFNGVVLLTAATLTFSTGPDSVDTNRFTLAHAFTSAALGVSSLTVATNSLASLSLGSVGVAVSSIKTALQSVGALLQRLAVKADNLAVAKLNVTAAASRILDADLATEQVEASKLQILQQTATSQLAAANASPASILSIFRR